MDDRVVCHFPMRSNPDDAWKAGLVSGAASGWNFRAIPHGRDDLLPGQKHHLADVNTARVRKLIEGLTHHPMQCGYAIGMLDARAADMLWAMHVIQHHHGPIAAAVVELVKRGAPKRWARTMLADVSMTDGSLEPYELVRVGLLDVAGAEAMIEAMPRGSGRAAMAMYVNEFSKLSWVMRMVMADPEGMDKNVAMLKRLSLKGAKS